MLSQGNCRLIQGAQFCVLSHLSHMFVPTKFYQKPQNYGIQVKVLCDLSVIGHLPERYACSICSVHKLQAVTVLWVTKLLSHRM